MALHPDSLPHACSVAQVLQTWQVGADQGLSVEQCVARQREYGPNQLDQAQPPRWWQKALLQLRAPLMLILLVTAMLAAAIGHVTDSVVIITVVLLNTGLGLVQENRAEGALAALQALLAPRARVLRGGESVDIAACDLVPGDVLQLAAGDAVPADARLIEAHQLASLEASLTGESLPVEKQVQPLPESTPLAERSNMVYMQTQLARGRALAVVIATGMHTEVGQLAAALLNTQDPPTPLQQQLAKLGRQLAWLAFAVLLLILGLGIWREAVWFDSLMLAVALAVAAVPEGLPAVVTLTLAVGMQRMARHAAIVRRLVAVETLGATTVICTDKTGTLTQNRLQLAAVCLPQGAATGWQIPPLSLGPGLEILCRAMVLCNDASADGTAGDPLEQALLDFARQHGYDVQALRQQYPRVAELPFDASHALMASAHPAGQSIELWVKGAPEAVLARCQRMGGQMLDSAGRQFWLGQMQAAAARGQRLLLLARSTCTTVPEDWLATLQGLEGVGLIALSDPLRPEAAAAIAACRRAGVAVKMITGDHPATAGAIAEQLGLSGPVLTGAELDALAPEARASQIHKIGVFARMSPAHKLEIVQTLQQHGEVVAMTGDGVNDAPALKAADIGVAMGLSGTAVSRGAAAMVLADDNFATLVKAIEAGRGLYQNILKFVSFQLGTNIGAILCVAGAVLTGLPAPFTPLQILWINLIMDGPPALTLGLAPPTGQLMTDPPRPRQQAILPWAVGVRLLVLGGWMAAATLWIYQQGRDAGHASSLAFTMFVCLQFVHLLCVREPRLSLLQARPDPHLVGVLVLVLALQLLVLYWSPMQNLFATQRLDLADWGLILCLLLPLLLLHESIKAVLRRQAS